MRNPSLRYPTFVISKPQTCLLDFGACIVHLAFHRVYPATSILGVLNPSRNHARQSVQQLERLQSITETSTSFEACTRRTNHVHDSDWTLDRHVIASRSLNYLAGQSPTIWGQESGQEGRDRKGNAHHHSHEDILRAMWLGIQSCAVDSFFHS